MPRRHGLIRLKWGAVFTVAAALSGCGNPDIGTIDGHREPRIETVKVVPAKKGPKLSRSAAAAARRNEKLNDLSPKTKSGENQR